MYSIEELELKIKQFKKELHELGGLGTIYPDNKKNLEDIISAAKKLLDAEKIYEENKTARFGKGAKAKKSATEDIAALDDMLTELEEQKLALDKNILPLPTILKSRADELLNSADTTEASDAEQLSFEELAFVFGSVVAKISSFSSEENKNEILIEKYNRLQKDLQKIFFRKLHETEEFFVAYSTATGLPYLDLREQQNQACLWLFTKEDYATNCKNHFAREYIFIKIVKFTNKEFFEYAKNLVRMGFNSIIINNGVHNLTVAAGAVIGAVNFSCPINPMLHIRRLDFFQALTLFNTVPQTNHTLYEKYHNPLLMKAKETVMLNEFSKAKYTIIAKSAKKTDIGGTESFEIPTAVKDDKRFLLIFSDMLEFEEWKKASGFKTEGENCSVKIMDFEAIDNVAKETESGLLLDIQNWCFELNDERREMIKNVARQVKKAEERANELLKKDN